jgi:hypothetical protein
METEMLTPTVTEITRLSPHRTDARARRAQPTTRPERTVPALRS